MRESVCGRRARILHDENYGSHLLRQRFHKTNAAYYILGLRRIRRTGDRIRRDATASGASSASQARVPIVVDGVVVLWMLSNRFTQSDCACLCVRAHKD